MNRNGIGKRQTKLGHPGTHEDRQFAKITHLFPYVSKTNTLCQKIQDCANKGLPNALPLTKVTHELAKQN